QVVELRVPNMPGRYRNFTVAGWFDDPAKLAQAAAQIERQRPPGIYVTLNPCNPALLCRGYNRIVEHPKATTADHDIIRRVWLPIDADPVRPAGTSSSPDEIEAARERIIQVETW